MSKSTKRNKKYNPVKQNTAILDNRFQKAYEELYFIGDEYRKPVCFNGHYLRYRLAPNVAAALQQKFIGMLLEEELDWNMIIVIFIKGDTEESIDVLNTNIMTKNTNMIEFANYVKENLKATIEMALKESGIDSKRLLTYGYAISYLQFEEDSLVESLTDKLFSLDLLEIAGKQEPYELTEKSLIESIMLSNTMAVVHDSKDIDKVVPKHVSDYVEVEA